MRTFGWGQHGLVTKSTADFVWFELALLWGSVRHQPAQPQGSFCFVHRPVCTILCQEKGLPSWLEKQHTAPQQLHFLPSASSCCARMAPGQLLQAVQPAVFFRCSFPRWEGIWSYAMHWHFAGLREWKPVCFDCPCVYAASCQRFFPCWPNAGSDSLEGAAWVQVWVAWPPCLTWSHSKHQCLSHGQCFGVCRGCSQCSVSHAGKILGC